MSKELYLKKALAVFMLILLLALSVFSFEGALLCLGEDGHVAVEFVNACNGAGFGNEIAGMEADACGPCKDVQFTSTPAYTRNVSPYTQALPLSFLPQMSPVLPVQDNSIKRAAPPVSSHQDKTLASLQSVVLLI